MGRSREITVQVVSETAGLAGQEHLFALTQAIAQKELGAGLQLIEQLHTASKDMARLCEEMISHLRNIMLFKTVKEPGSLVAVGEEEYRKTEEQAHQFTLERVLQLMEGFQQCLEAMGRGSNRRMELELAARCDMVFATAQPLADRLRAANPRTAFIPNGADFDLFHQAAQPRPVPEDLRELAGPILGFVGALQGCIEYGFVAEAARARPDWQFVFIGRALPGVDLSALEALPNVRFLGLKPHGQLPDYIARFDVCLNLFAPSDLSKDVSPLKFYEYLATGKPIVSTPQPDQVLQYAPLLHIAHTAAEFQDACAAALAENAPQQTAARIEAGRQSAWDARVAQMEALLQDAGVL